MDGFFAQARQSLGSIGPDSLERQWPGKVRVVATSQPLLAPAIEPGIFEAVCEALYANLWLQLTYKNAAGQQSDIEVMPLGLAQQGPRLYLVCRYKGFDNERMLALHRMRKARVTTFGFERPRGFDLKQFDDEGRFGYGEGKRIRLSFRIDKDAGQHLLETPLSADQKVKEIGCRYEISATVMDTAMLDWWLRGFGKVVGQVKKSKMG
jgi:predicted DNA-binding transcriptional regulator YafY